MKPIIIETEDGSHTLYMPNLDEHYHSVKGAVSESSHVFINMGFDRVINTERINILEVGFGTGLNCLLTYITSVQKRTHIFYDALEPFPVKFDLIKKLNYVRILKFGDADKLLKIFYQSEVGIWHIINDNFSFRKNIKKIEDINLVSNKYDIVYYDAFGPMVQPEMWGIDNFIKIYKSMKKGGILVTYCAKGQVRRDLQHSGFKVERLQGPRGKREMLRAVK